MLTSLKNRTQDIWCARLLKTEFQNRAHQFLKVMRTFLKVVNTTLKGKRTILKVVRVSLKAMRTGLKVVRTSFKIVRKSFEFGCTVLQTGAHQFKSPANENIYIYMKLKEPRNFALLY